MITITPGTPRPQNPPIIITPDQPKSWDDLVLQRGKERPTNEPINVRGALTGINDSIPRALGQDHIPRSFTVRDVMISAGIGIKTVQQAISIGKEIVSGGDPMLALGKIPAVHVAQRAVKLILDSTLGRLGINVDIFRRDSSGPSDLEKYRLENTLLPEGWGNPLDIKSELSQQAIFQSLKPELAKNNKQYIYLVALDSQVGADGNPIYDKIKLPFTPESVKVDSDLKVTVIPSISRNNPFYHYTGSEDTLTFEIDWYAIEGDDNREYVISRCQWLKAMAKSDSYANGPCHIKVIWGGLPTDGNSTQGLQPALFKDDKWIITKADYVLTDFHRSVLIGPESMTVHNVAMMPIQAKQELTLKKITPTNTTRIQNLWRGQLIGD